MVTLPTPKETSNLSVEEGLALLQDCQGKAFVLLDVLLFLPCVLRRNTVGTIRATLGHLWGSVVVHLSKDLVDLAYEGEARAVAIELFSTMTTCAGVGAKYWADQLRSPGADNLSRVGLPHAAALSPMVQLARELAAKERVSADIDAFEARLREQILVDSWRPGLVRLSTDYHPQGLLAEVVQSSSFRDDLGDVLLFPWKTYVDVHPDHVTLQKSSSPVEFLFDARSPS